MVFITRAMDGVMENTLHKVAVEIRMMHLSCMKFVITRSKLEERERDECVGDETAGAC